MTNKIIEIKDKIKQLMKEKNMSIYQLSLKSGVTDSCIRNWYSKRNYAPNLEPLEKVAKALDVSLTQLLLDKDETLYPVDKQTKEFIEMYLTLNKNQKQLILDLMKEFKK